MTEFKYNLHKKAGQAPEQQAPKKDEKGCGCFIAVVIGIIVFLFIFFVVLS